MPDDIRTLAGHVCKHHLPRPESFAGVQMRDIAQFVSEMILAFIVISAMSWGVVWVLGLVGAI